MAGWLAASRGWLLTVFGVFVVFGGWFVVVLGCWLVVMRGLGVPAWFLAGVVRFLAIRFWLPRRLRLSLSFTLLENGNYKVFVDVILVLTYWLCWIAVPWLRHRLLLLRSCRLHRALSKNCDKNQAI